MCPAQVVPLEEAHQQLQGKVQKLQAEVVSLQQQLLQAHQGEELREAQKHELGQGQAGELTSGPTTAAVTAAIAAALAEARVGRDAGATSGPATGAVGRWGVAESREAAAAEREAQLEALCALLQLLFPLLGAHVKGGRSAEQLLNEESTTRYGVEEGVEVGGRHVEALEMGCTWGMMKWQ